MKKDNLKKSVKIVKKSKSLSKGVILKSAKNENPNRGATTPRPSLVRRGLGRWFRSLKFGFRIYRVAGLFVLFAILGFTAWQALLPQSARSKTFTFFQTAWSAIAALVLALTVSFSRAIIKLVNPPRATERSCGVLCL